MQEYRLALAQQRTKSLVKNRLYIPNPKGHRLFNSSLLNPVKFIITLALLVLIQSAHGQTVRDDVGYTALLDQMGAGTPNGAGIAIGIIEPAFAGKDNPDITAWLPYPDISDISQVTLRDASGGSTADSTHSARVSQFLFGQSDGLATGIAEANYYSLSDFIYNKLVPLTNYVGTLQPSAFLYSLGAKVFENRINNISAISSDADNNATLLRRFDWATAHEDVINSISAGNSSLSPTLFSSSYNSIYIGITAGSSGKRAASIDNIYSGLRQRPDVVTPMRNSSRGTATASSITSVLLETARDAAATLSNVSPSNTQVLTRNAEKSEVMKAVLMAGADRKTSNTRINSIPRDEAGERISGEPEYIADITNYRAAGYATSNGLDSRFGAGQANVHKSHQILTGGEQDSQEDGGNTSVSLLGFDYDEAFGNGAGDANPNSVASYLLPTLTRDANLDVTLAWNLDVYSGDGLFVNALLYDLDLWLYDVTDDAEVLVNASLSSVDNTETISQLLSAGRDYEFRVTTEKNVTALLWDYGIAWRVDQESDTLAAPLTLESPQMSPSALSFSASSVPIPSSLFLFITGLFALVVKKHARQVRSKQ
ncbi:hypothetical protein N9527_01250 [Pseudomonadales bacterium]|nr:hypothetical protein [Pseudomonadales bacterium]